MSTLEVNSPLDQAVGDRGSIPIVDNDIVYEGAAVGEVKGEGYGRPLSAGDKFIGHSIDKVDNTSGSDGDLNIRLLNGRYRLVVSLVGLITDLGQPVYMSDDATYTFAAVAFGGQMNSFVGRISRYVDATHMEVEFDTNNEGDEFDPNPNRETRAVDDEITTAAETGLVIYVTVNAKIIKLPSTVAGVEFTIVNAGGYNTVGLVVDFQDAEDKSLGGCGLAAGGDGAAITNTKSTAQRGDFIKLRGDGTDGYSVIGLRGTWTQA